MAIVTGDRYLEKLVHFVEDQAGPLIEGALVLKLNPAGLHYVQSRLEALHELESLLSGAPVDYLRAYVSDLGDHRALEQLRRILRLLTSLKVVSVLPHPIRDPTPLSFLPLGCLKVLELRGCDLSTSAAKGLLELRHTLEKIVCHNSTDALRHVFASRITEVKKSPQWTVETLDLSRNKFAKVDNLHKCTKLRHLDLGFNNLRAFAPFSQVSCHIVKLVLRNNALTTLRGIENLKSLEGVDISYNIISNFSELEFLAGLPYLQSLWLEGNPLCCARWYRAQVFSFFAYPERLKLDEKEINSSDFWKRQIIVASMHKRPASFGIYVPAKDEAVVEGGNIRRRKVSRLVSIKNEEEITSICSDEDSVSCANDIQDREDPDLSDNEAEIVDLINRVEHMKKERSIHWLREFKDWMDIASDKSVETGKEGSTTLHRLKENYIRNKTNQQPGDISRYASDSVLASGDESSMTILESDGSFVDMSAFFHRLQHFDYRGLLAQRMAENVNISPLTTIHDISGSQSSSAYPSSPPHFQEDLLHRRQHLVEEILQLSADSFSVASSDSNTSCSEGDCSEFEPSVPKVVNFPCKNYVNGSVDGHLSQNQLKGKFYNPKQNAFSTSSSTCDQTSKQNSIDFAAGADNAESASQDTGLLGKRKIRKKAKKRIISILEENSDGDASDHTQEQISEGQVSANLKQELGINDFTEFSGHNYPTQENDDLIVTYFNTSIADSEASEVCSQCMRCSCVLQRETNYKESEVAVLLSSHKKLYLLLINVASDGPGTLLSVLSCHKIEEVCEVQVGMALQVLRVNFENGETYLFVTRSIEKSRELLCTIHVLDSCGGNARCSIRSLEQVQVELFDNQICGGSNVSIYQYAMVLVFCENGSEESWLSRSLFVIGGYVLLCIEDVKQLYTFSSDSSASPYFRIDSCCSIADITETVIEVGGNCYVTLSLTCSPEELHSSTQMNLETVNHKNTAPGTLKLKLQWFSKDYLVKFVSLLKAIHEKESGSPLVVRCIS
uniref:Serine/threonine kinase 11-interacting protein n=1 Tax=Cajanus cajan TaxID=3821 RepID=A0A151TK68_CAJCA|nr:Serine/threonine kinase 11-interacting protein [Cajanus cajan]